MTTHRCGVVPPYLLEHLAGHADQEVAARARHTLAHDEHARQARTRHEALPGQEPDQVSPVPNLDSPNRVISDAKHTEQLPGTLIRREGDPAARDPAVNQAYDGLWETWTLYKRVYERSSLDDRGLPLLATVHYGRGYDNAFWDGTQMVFGDGDGQIFGPFTTCLDVIGHELTHGVTETTAGLVYRDQSGALNESISDVFGSLVKQYTAQETADEADWLIGEGLLMPSVHGVALRSMKAPGTAYDDPQLGKDPQPDHMDRFVKTKQDNGGVHINSGIPNKAFYLAAVAIGGHAWEKAGQIWYDALTGDAISASCDFAAFAALTVTAAQARFGAQAAEVTAVQQAWQGVGVTPAAATTKKKTRRQVTARQVTVSRSGGFAGLTRRTTGDGLAVSCDEQEQWHTLLSGQLEGFAAQAQTQPHPDGFSYEVSTDGGHPIEIPEHAVPGTVRDLLQRTLNQ